MRRKVIFKYFLHGYVVAGGERHLLALLVRAANFRFRNPLRFGGGTLGGWSLRRGTSADLIL